MFIINPKDAFNDLFTNIDQKLSGQIPKPSKAFEAYVNKLNVIMDSKPLSIYDTTQKMKFFIKDFFSKCDQIRSVLRI